jgi:hypothetical protein
VNWSVRSYPSAGRVKGILVLTLALLLVANLGFAQANKITTTFDGITFDSSYDNGSIAGITRRAENDYDALLFTEVGEKGTAKYWFRFTMTGVSNRTITLHLDHAQNPRPFLRALDPNPSNWRRMTASEAPNTSTLILTFGPQTNAVELAFFEPLGYQETLTSVTNLISASPYAALTTIGQSHENRDLHLITVNDPSYPDHDKKRVWVHARAHAAEVTSSHTMLGFLEQVLDASDVGTQLRRTMTFHVVPTVNADGTWRGYTRWDAQGFDIESEWCNIRAPEAAALKTQIDGLMTATNPISVALNLHSTQGNFTDSFFFKHLAPSVSSNFEQIQQRYINALDAATPLFDNLSPQASQLNACTFIESYFWNNWGESVMAMTHEGHYYRRITDNAWIDGAHYREIGRAMARALISYYSVPPTNDPGLPTTFFRDDFDSYNSPVLVTNAAITNGYKIFYGANSGTPNFSAVFGFDYSTVNIPFLIPPAPNTTNGTSKGLLLTVNKGATGNIAALNLYPTNQTFSNNFAFKFDLWINWSNAATATEHALFGINHSGAVTNRVEQLTSDGLFFAIAGDGGATTTSLLARDFSVFRGGGNSAPFLMLTNNTVFGPTPPLGGQFANGNPGFMNLFPSLPAYGGTPVGSAGLRWISVEVRHEYNLVTWLLNGTAVAQYTNTTTYTNGSVMIGYNDLFASIGSVHNFALFDNIRVESIPLNPVTIVGPNIAANALTFRFVSERYKTYTVEQTSSLDQPTWSAYSNVLGNGNTITISVPAQAGPKFFRVQRP